MRGFPRYTLLGYTLLAGLSALPSAAFQAGSDPHQGMQQQLQSLLTGDLSTGFILAALGVSFFAGAAHALTPGHGKAIVAAYLAGSRGTIGDAVYLGSVVTVTHTAGVFILGLVALYASQHLLVDRVLVWLSLISGLLIVGIGTWLFWSRWQALRNGTGGQHSHSHWPFGGHSHTHEHSHAHPHSHSDAHEHSHSHSHSHDHQHSHDAPHSHSHDQDHGHEHGHSKPALPKSGRGSLLSLGISGGLVPCPEAMAVLLVSITINRLLFGLVILVSFSLGLAAVLIAIGVAMVLAGPTFNRFSKDGLLVRLIPVSSAAVVTLLGVAILYRAAAEGGIL